MGFRTVERPYTKADYYREMEERHAAKIAARAAAVVVVPIKDPEWLEQDNLNVAEISSNTIETKEEIVIPFIEPPVVAQTIKQETESTNNIETVTDEVELPTSQEEPVKKVSKQKRKKTG